jgi:ribosomal protein L37E
MDHSSLAEQKHECTMCEHGFCRNHNPDWEVSTRQEPNPGIFGAKTYWISHHCGRAMARYRVVQTKRCRKCGRTEEEVVNYNLALCLCCGYHRDILPLGHGCPW